MYLAAFLFLGPPQLVAATQNKLFIDQRAGLRFHSGRLLFLGRADQQSDKAVKVTMLGHLTSY